MTQFLNVPYPDEWENFLYQISHDGQSEDENADWLHVANEDMWEYTVIRDSTKAAFSWMEQIEFKENLSIQRSCNAIMKYFGYKTFKSKEAFEEAAESVEDVSGQNIDTEDAPVFFLAGDENRASRNETFQEAYKNKRFGWKCSHFDDPSNIDFCNDDETDWKI